MLCSKLVNIPANWTSSPWVIHIRRVDGGLLSNIRFSDDILVFSTFTIKTEAMLAELNEAGSRVGLRMRTHFEKNAYCTPKEDTAAEERLL